METTIETRSARDWNRLVLSLIGREVTSEESSEIEKKKRHNWTVRTTAESILGRNVTESELATLRNE